MNVLDLFSGIGGFSLGLERAGMRTVAFCEIDPYARAVLRKHWPTVPIFNDVRTVTATSLAETLGWHSDSDHTRSLGGLPKGAHTKPGRDRIDIICGGFPCQDISTAGKRAGLAGARSGLWSEFARLISEIRPRYAIVENVSALLGRGIERVLGDLAEIGYDAEWHCIPASAVGAPHQRDRIWIIAYANCERHECRAEPNAWGFQEISRNNRLSDVRSEVANSNSEPLEWPAKPWNQHSHWLVEPDVGRVVDGIFSRVDRLKCLGNAVVPQIPEIIGRAIMNSHAM